LKLSVREALDYAKATKPAVGWIRGDAIASFDALEELAEVRKELAEVRKENAKYRDTIGHLTVELALPPIPAAEEQVLINLLPCSLKNRHGGTTSGTSASLSCTWIGAFPIFHSSLVWYRNDQSGEIDYNLDEERSCNAIGAAFAAETASFDCAGLFRINKGTFDRLCSYYIEVGLMNSEGERPFPEAAQRFARRHRINGGVNARPIIIEGSIESKNSPATKRDLDDEVPF
jgi:hypothetical protein